MAQTNDGGRVEEFRMRRCASRTPDLNTTHRVFSRGLDCWPIHLILEMTSKLKGAVAAAAERFGRIDVVVNNAGHGLLGAVEQAQDVAAALVRLDKQLAAANFLCFAYWLTMTGSCVGLIWMYRMLIPVLLLSGE